MQSIKSTSKLAAILAVATLLTGPAVFASPLAVHSPVQAMFGKARTVSFSMRNDSAQPIKVKAGSEEVILEPGKKTDLKLNVGEQVLVAEATSTMAVGVILATADTNLSNATIVLK